MLKRCFEGSKVNKRICHHKLQENHDEVYGFGDGKHFLCKQKFHLLIIYEQFVIVKLAFHIPYFIFEMLNFLNLV